MNIYIPGKEKTKKKHCSQEPMIRSAWEKDRGREKKQINIAEWERHLHRQWNSLKLLGLLGEKKIHCTDSMPSAVWPVDGCIENS